MLNDFLTLVAHFGAFAFILYFIKEIFSKGE
jgi:hypothetical protein